MKIARIYERVSTSEQDLIRQAELKKMVIARDFYIAGIYREIASDIRCNRPELLRMIADLQPEDLMATEKLTVSVVTFFMKLKNYCFHQRQRYPVAYSRLSGFIRSSIRK